MGESDFFLDPSFEMVITICALSIANSTISLRARSPIAFLMAETIFFGSCFGKEIFIASILLKSDFKTGS
ncbi:hypothetical protein EBZ80_10910 [bacterium]|nr:hypothetical protein [bacterium]